MLLTIDGEEQCSNYTFVTVSMSCNTASVHMQTSKALHYPKQ